MSNLGARIKKRLNMTANAFRQDSSYSLNLALYRLGDDLGGRLGLNQFSYYCNDKKHAWILHYLSENLGTLLDAYRNKDELGTAIENAPIWVCWWSGEESAPPLVKQCVKSIRNHAGNHPVYLITQENCSQYLDIPEYISQKLGDGKLGIANFSDYLRFSLLNRYGGLWLDATIYCSDTIPEWIFERPLFTCKGEPSQTKYISRCEWTSFVFGGWRGNSLFVFFQKAFEYYWKIESQAIDYLFVDYLIRLGLENNASIRKCFDALPCNNPHRDDLQAAMNEKAPAEKWDEIIKDDTVLYKLSWREKYALKTDADEDTVYAKLLNN